MSEQNGLQFETFILQYNFYSYAKIHFPSSLLAKMACLSKGDVMSEKAAGHFACVRGVIFPELTRFRKFFYQR